LKYRQLSEEAMASASDADLVQNLADLRRINLWTGARAKLRQVLRKHCPRHSAFTLLDIGGASGDMALDMARHFPSARTITLDLEARNLRAAPAPKLVGDAFHLPFADNSCDVVHCALFLHHFSDAQCVELLREMHRVARRLVLAQDLHRHWIAYSFLPLTRPLLRWHQLTVDDGKLSVAAGWRRAELESILRQAGMAEGSSVEWHFPSFRYFIAKKKSAPY
jgi:ubiquinone/menaquinone biosynthesis C-methylase UbiE